MRLTTASVAAVALIAAGIVTFWPGGNAGPGRATTVAQDPNQPGTGPQQAGGRPGTGVPTAGTPAESTLADKLNQRLDAEFVETPLKDAIEFLAERSQIQIIIKRKRLEELGVNYDTPVTLNLKNVRLSTLFDVMLEDLGLVYTEKDDIVLITTPDDAQATMEVRVYDCRDLLTMPSVTLHKAGAMMMPGEGGFGGPRGMGVPGYGAAGGDSAFGPPPGSGYPARGSLPGAPDAGGGGPIAPPSIGSPPPSGSIPGPGAPGGGQPPPRRPRNDILPQVGGAMPGNPAGQPGAMGGMMGGPGMIGGSGMGGMAGGGLGGQAQPQRPMTAEELKAEQLLHIITTAVNPDSWQEMGGPGTIGEYNGLVVVSQSARTHSKIEKVLDMLREAADLSRAPGPRVVR